MVEDHRLGQFKIAYANEVTGGYVLSNGNPSEMDKYSVHKRAVSSKKLRTKKIKNKAATVSRGGVADQSYNQSSYKNTASR